MYGSFPLGKGGKRAGVHFSVAPWVFQIYSLIFNSCVLSFHKTIKHIAISGSNMWVWITPKQSRAIKVGATARTAALHSLGSHSPLTMAGELVSSHAATA